jgi:hypothetical protein
MSMPRISDHLDVGYPAGGGEDVPCGAEVCDGNASRAPYPQAVPERLLAGPQDGRESSVTGVDARLDEPDAQPVWRDDVPGVVHLLA